MVRALGIGLWVDGINEGVFGCWGFHQGSDWPLSVVTRTCTVGFPLESNLWAALTADIILEKVVGFFFFV